jgi:hypothetical protein
VYFCFLRLQELYVHLAFEATVQYVFLYLAQNSFAPVAVGPTLMLLYITGANLSFLELAELRVSAIPN